MTSQKLPQKPTRNKYGRGSYHSFEGADGKPVFQASKSLTVVDDSGVKHRKRVTGTGASENEACERLQARLKLFYNCGREITPPKPQRTSAETITVAEFVGLWKEHMLIRLDPVSETVLRKYMVSVSNHVIRYVGELPIAEFNGEVVKKLFRVALPSLKKADGSLVLGPQGLLSVGKALNMVLNHAVRESSSALTVNPLNKESLLPKVVRPDEPISEWADRTLKLIPKLRRHPDAASFLLQYLALRKSERLGLEWSKITFLQSDAGNSHLSIEQQLARAEDGSGLYLNGKLKTKSSKRVIPIPKMWLDSLRAEKVKQDTWKKLPVRNSRPEFADLVFTHPDGRPITQGQDNASFKKVLAENGLDYRLHVARHITATYFAQQDNPPVPLATMKPFLGHSSETMAQHYTASEFKVLVNPMAQYGDYQTGAADSAEDAAEAAEHMAAPKYRATASGLRLERSR